MRQRFLHQYFITIGIVIDAPQPKYNRMAMCIGYAIGGVSFFLMGPAPFLPLPYVVILVIIKLLFIQYRPNRVVLVVERADMTGLFLWGLFESG